MKTDVWLVLVGLGGPCWWALGFSCYLRSSEGLVSIVPLYSPAAATLCISQHFSNQLNVTIVFRGEK